jgi:hypothetical protein
MRQPKPNRALEKLKAGIRESIPELPLLKGLDALFVELPPIPGYGSRTAVTAQTRTDA